MVNPEIKQSFIPVGRYNRPRHANPCNYITIHDTGNYDKGADAYRHSEYLKNPSTKESWHYTVDDREIYQHLPDSESAYHAGDGAGKGNRQSIGIEICVNSDGNLYAAADRAALLTAYLMEKHGIPIGNVVQHNHWYNKDCPHTIRSGVPCTWQEFLKKAEEYMKREITAEEAVEMLYKAGVLSDKGYWLEALMHIKNLDALFIKMAAKIGE